MDAGLRQHKSASLRIAIAEGLPESMRPLTREVVDVRSENPNKGHARALLHEVCTEADNYWVTLLVQVHAFDDGMSDEQLVKFYSRFGFEQIQVEPILMARSPQLPKIARIH